MNFLAHVYLSGDNPDIITGNFIGDFVKGRHLHDKFEPGVIKGIQLHRLIDEYTDSHPVVTQSKSRLRPKYRHYAPVIVDMFYDHFLAKNWNRYHPTPLAEFALGTYTMLQARQQTLPEGAQRLLPYMVNGNWLVGYGHIEGIQRALTGMSRRTKFDSHMEDAAHELREFYTDFDNEFKVFFPELEEQCETFLRSIS